MIQLRAIHPRVIRSLRGTPPLPNRLYRLLLLLPGSAYPENTSTQTPSSAFDTRRRCISLSVCVCHTIVASSIVHCLEWRSGGGGYDGGFAAATARPVVFCCSPCALRHPPFCRRALCHYQSRANERERLA